jgi:hypothetical protein
LVVEIGSLKAYLGVRTERSLADWVPCGGTCPAGFKSPTWHGCSHFSEFILWFNSPILSVVGDVSVDSEVPMMTSSISRFADPTQSFRGTHRGRVCVRAFIRVRVHSYVSVSVCNWISQNKKAYLGVMLNYLYNDKAW